MKDYFKYFALIGVSLLFKIAYLSMTDVSASGYHALFQLVISMIFCIIFGILTIVIIRWKLPRISKKNIITVLLLLLTAVLIYIVVFEVLLRRFYQPTMSVYDLFVLQYINALFWGYQLTETRIGN